MARIQAPPSSARRQPERTANEITVLSGLYQHPSRRYYRLGTRPRKQYFVSRADQHLTPANWWGIDPDLIPIRAPIGVQAGIGKPLASQTLGLNVQQPTPRKESNRCTGRLATRPGARPRKRLPSSGTSRAGRDSA